jgi:FAD/FMN-containing dehydrogenase
LQLTEREERRILIQEGTSCRESIALARSLEDITSKARVATDRLRTLSYGTDANFYRLIPRIVVTVESEAELIGVMAACAEVRAPVTFRAAGTSLSGQAITDSVLIMLGEGWQRSSILDEGRLITLQPGIIGAEANRRLVPFGRKIGPDPASIGAAMIGGIAANNASGMCCGTAQNSYQTLQSLRVVLADGAVLDTGSSVSRAAFAEAHSSLLADLAALAREVQTDSKLAGRIRHKFAIKNTTGYSLNALVDYQDPFEVLQHLMIGSEGTLGFISEITYRTVPDHGHKACALLFFETLVEACRAVTRLKREPVAAVELMDRASLASVTGKPGMPDFLASLGPDATALLVEIQGADGGEVSSLVSDVSHALSETPPSRPVEFSTDPYLIEKYWKIRKGLFPAVGAVRPVGTTVIIEDVAVPIESLAPATADLQDALIRHGYAEAIIFGHALDGNLHFVFAQGFADDQAIRRYAALMEEVAEIIVGRYDGSLKAEHGTGRNMAPFVEMEWGKQATDLMWRIKRLFDPRVVYFASCAGQMFGPARDDRSGETVATTLYRLLDKAGFEIITPARQASLCCGQPSDSKGLFGEADRKAEETISALIQASEDGRWPVFVDTNPCAQRLKSMVAGRLKMLDIAEFLHDHVLPNVDIPVRITSPIALHLTCSTRQMGLDATLLAVAQACAEHVVVPADIGCCGFAGDKGFVRPEMNAHALRSLAPAVKDCTAGYSTSRTCEIGLSVHGGLTYRLVADLVDSVAHRRVRSSAARVPAEGAES